MVDNYISQSRVILGELNRLGYFPQHQVLIVSQDVRCGELVNEEHWRNL